VNPEDVLRQRDLAGAGLPDGALGSLCSVAHAALCDGFESPNIQLPPWNPIVLGAEVTIDGNRAFRGLQSLRVHTDAMGDASNGYVRQGEVTETVAVPQPDLYARVFVYVPSPMPIGRFRLLGALQANGPNDGPQLACSDGKLAYDTTAGVAPSTTALPLDRWFCLEWQVSVASSGELHVWLDDVEVSGLHTVGNTPPSPGIARFSMGAFYYGSMPPQPAYDFWFDEVVLDSARIGCAR
jgi:hypothetical protein